LPAKLTLTEDSRILTSAPSPSPSPSPSSGPPSARGTRASKWGRLLGSSSVDSASDTSTKVAVSRSLSARESLRESAQGRQSSSSSSNGGQGNKVFPKTPKLSPGPATLARQDTIDEGGEGDPSPQRGIVESRPVLERQATERDRLLEISVATGKDREKLILERNLSLERERERQIEMASSRATMSETYDTGLREQPPTLAQRDLIATVLDMKVDVRLEMQRMGQRIGRIEEMLAVIAKRLAQDSSGHSTPGDESIPVVPSTTVVIGTLGVTTTTTTPGTVTTSAMAMTPTSSQNPSIMAAGIAGGSGSGGNGLGPILLRKRRSKSRKAPAPPKQSPEQARLLEAELPSTSSTRKREFL